MPSASFRCTDMSISARADSPGDDLEMIGLAAHDAAERHRAVVRPAGGRRRVERDRQAGGNLERAGHADEVVGRAGGFERAGRAFEQMRADRVVEARLDDQEASALDARRGRVGGAARLGHAESLFRSCRNAARP